MKHKRRPMDVEQARVVLFDVRAILDRSGLPFFLILGTCLGVVRDKRLIDHDFDIDLGTRIEDLRPLITALAELFVLAGYAVKLHDAPCVEPRAITVTRDGIKVDIAGFIRNGGARFCPSGAIDYCLVYPAEFFDTIEEREAYGAMWPVPAQPERYLAFHYGPKWQTPDPKWKPQLGPARKYAYFRTVKR